MAVTDRLVTLTPGQYGLALDRLKKAGIELEELLRSDGLSSSERLMALRTLGEVECLRVVLESWWKP